MFFQRSPSSMPWLVAPFIAIGVFALVAGVVGAQTPEEARYRDLRHTVQAHAVR